jgi:GMP synthase-like glutamine amidotransferase
MNVLCIRHHDEDDAGLIADALIERGATVTTILVTSSSDLPSAQNWDFVVILGSKHATYDPEVEEKFFAAEMQFIRDIDARGVGILGICFGCQALCRVFGGSVQQAPEGEVGWFEVSPTAGSPISRGPWFEFHFDHCTLPAQAVAWAHTERAVQAFAIGRHVGTQFHPEIDARQLRAWMSSDGDDVRSLGFDPEALISQTLGEEANARQRARDLVAVALQQAGLA